MIRPRNLTIALALLLPLSFWLGYRTHRHAAPAGGSAVVDGRKVLYYVDPMNPAFRSAEPGIAPCGMPLEPVYADGGGAGPTAGALTVRADRQQLIGVRVETVARRAASHRLRLLGRVAADESRLFRLFSVTAGWVREAGPATTGSIVGRGEVLAAYYAPDLGAPQQTFLNTVETHAKVKETRQNPYDNLQGGDQLAAYERNLSIGRQTLQNLGVSAEQVAEIERTRKAAALVEVRAPASGLVLARNLSLGQRFEEGTELYTIADLGRVWVLADAGELDARHFKAGAQASVTQPGLGRTLGARVSPVLPRFDPETRTLKVRLEVDNPGYVLRPDMFVDVEMPVETPAAITVHKEAVIDSGTRKVVYVRVSEGMFEPRRVETGLREGDRVEIVSGLNEGEIVVVSGNFLLDSESRMRAAGSEPPAAAGTAIDPMCGMSVNVAEAMAAGRVSTHEGRRYYFCAPVCKERFDEDPAAHAPKGEPRPPASGR
jgi:RND family efflux transporter MFP subunit